MSEADPAIVKQEVRNPYVTVFVSDSDVTADDTEDPRSVNSHQIIVHADDGVAVEEFKDIHCVISHENGTFESSENEDLSFDSNRTLWTRKNVKLLIDEYKTLQEEFQDPRRKQKDLWAILSANLSEKIAKEAGEHSSWMASQVTWDACDRKWRNLKHTFKTIHTNQWRSFRSRSRWEFYGPLLDIFGDNLDCSRQKKPEKTRYVIVHPPNIDGERSILVPSTRKSGGIKSPEISQVSEIIAAEDGVIGDNAVFLEEVDESTGANYVVVKSSSQSSPEPVEKKVKLAHVVHGPLKHGEAEDNEAVHVEKVCDLSSKEPSLKLKKTDWISESDSVGASGSAVTTKDDNCSSPPVWFVNFLKEYGEEEKRRRDALTKAHEDMMRIEHRKIKALESILNKLVSVKSSKSEETDNANSKVDHSQS